MNGNDLCCWLRRRQRNRQDGVGDLARALNADPNAPQRGGRNVLRKYLEEHGASEAVLHVLDQATTEWKGRC